MAKKKKLLNIFIKFLALLHVKWLIKRNNNSEPSALILPPTSSGSLGDEAMLTATIHYLRTNGFKHIGLISYDQSKWEYLDPPDEIINLHNYFYNNSWKDIFRFVYLVSHYEYFYLLGADVLDGYYSDQRTYNKLYLTSLAARLGVITTILGFSLNENPTPLSIQTLQQLPSEVRICARDPVSKERLVNYLNHPVKLVADLAFMLQPVDDSENVMNVLKWVNKQKHRDHIVIGINANNLIIKDMVGSSIENLIKVYVDMLIRLYSQNNHFRFLLIPHDSRSSYSDIALAKSILKALPDKIQSYCICDPTPCSAAEIKSICGNLDFVLCSRMHIAIACLGQGTPVACIEYQGKFKGLYKHFELNGMIIDQKQALQPELLFSFIKPLIDQRDEIREQIKLKFPRIQQLAQSNFQ